MALITNTRQSQTSSQENWDKHGHLDIPKAGSCEPDGGLQLELNLWNMSLVQADHPTYTTVTDRSCDVTVTLDIGLVPCSG
jgi:hypothetical protein